MAGATFKITWLSLKVWEIIRNFIVSLLRQIQKAMVFDRNIPETAEPVYKHWNAWQGKSSFNIHK